jgi:hypothetical protein
MSAGELASSEWIKSRIADEPYWFHRIELPGGIVTPGWSDPKIDKLPYFGLPADMTGMRVLDIGNAEGFFSFEAERRGAAEVIGMQTATCADTSDKPMAEFHPFGITSGPADKPEHDPTCFWFPNVACCIAMLQHVGFLNVEQIKTTAPVGAVCRGQVPSPQKGAPPDEMKAPWS